MKKIASELGSIELIVLGLLAALIVVLAVPYVSQIEQDNPQTISSDVETQTSVK